MQGLACGFEKPEPSQARPKPGLSGQAGAGKSLGSTSMAGGGPKSSVGVVAGAAAEKRLTARWPVFGRGRGAWEVAGA
jgi:hypothetical protein